MKIFHISDIHLGKKLSGYSLIEDQKYILNQILENIKTEKPSVLMIAGDIYDTSNPSVEAVELFDYFLSELNKIEITVLIISGNHDQASRLAFGKSIFSKNNIIIASEYNGKLEKYTAENINFYMLPFIRPYNVREFCPNREIATYNDAVKFALEEVEENDDVNILMAHQFVSGSAVSDSEVQSVGGLDAIDKDVFSKFDYVALGHLHKEQGFDDNKIRYCGSPLKYSFSEVNNKNSITVIDVNDKDKYDIKISTILLKPLIGMLDIEGKIDDITSSAYLNSIDSNAYVRIKLTDDGAVYNPISRLSQCYSHFVTLKMDNSFVPTVQDCVLSSDELEKIDPIEVFTKLYKHKRDGAELSKDASKLINDLIGKVWGEKNENN